jgi:hypothetical protein
MNLEIQIGLLWPSRVYELVNILIPDRLMDCFLDFSEILVKIDKFHPLNNVFITFYGLCDHVGTINNWAVVLLYSWVLIKIV